MHRQTDSFTMKCGNRKLLNFPFFSLFSMLTIKWTLETANLVPASLSVVKREQIIFLLSQQALSERKKYKEGRFIKEKIEEFTFILGLNISVGCCGQSNKDPSFWEYQKYFRHSFPCVAIFFHLLFEIIWPKRPSSI